MSLPFDQIAFCDYETFFDSIYTLKKMKMTEYIRDARFEAQTCAIKLGDAPASSHVGFEAIADALHAIDWSRTAFCGHHTQFDGLIATHHFGVYPAFWLDTLSMARMVYGVDASHALGPLTERLGRPGKVHAQALKDVQGKQLRDMTLEEVAALAEYNRDDADDTAFVFSKLRSFVPEEELRVIDMTVRMYAEPVFIIDEARVQRAYEDERDRKAKLLEAVGLPMSELSSSDKFAEHLRVLGIEPPTKISMRTKKRTWAFSKQDIEFKVLQQHPDERVRNLVEARLASKSTLVETRAETIAGRADYPTPVYLNYWGARCVPGDVEVLARDGWQRLDEWSGGDIVQYTSDGRLVYEHADRFEGPEENEWVQVDAPYVKCDFTLGHTVPYLAHSSFNLRTLKAAELADRASVYIPTSGELHCDGLLQPAAMRVLAMVQADGHFETSGSNGRALFVKVKKQRKIDRCRQLLQDAAIPFEERRYPSQPDYVRFKVKFADYPNWLTSDRKFFGAWLLTAGAAAVRAFVEELPYWDGHRDQYSIEYYTSEPANAEWVQTLAHLAGMEASVTVKRATRNRRSSYTVTLRSKRHTVVKRAHVSRVTNPRRTYCTVTKHGYWLARSKGTLFITGNTGRWSGGDGVNYQNLPKKGIGFELRRSLCAPPGTTLVISDASQIEARMLAWDAGQQDVLDAFAKGDDVYCLDATNMYGRSIVPRKENQPLERQVGKTFRLGAGYGASGRKINYMMKIGAIGPVILQPLDETEQLIAAWRAANNYIVRYWHEAFNCAVTAFMHRQQVPFRSVCFEGTKRGGYIHLPNNTWLFYPGVHWTDTDCTHGDGMAYVGRNGLVNFWHGLVVENVIQALARAVLAHQLVRMEETLGDIRIATTTHDEVVAVVPEAESETYAREITRIMSTPPEWARGLPLSAETHVSPIYQKH